MVRPGVGGRRGGGGVGDGGGWGLGGGDMMGMGRRRGAMMRSILTVTMESRGGKVVDEGVDELEQQDT